MKTSGEILKTYRLQKNLTLESIEKVTKIRKKFLEALEDGELEKLPGETYVQGFVKNYAEFLELSTPDILAVLRREYYERKKKEIIPQGLAHPLSNNTLFSQKIAVPGAFFIGFIIFAIYLYSQFLQFQSQPSLKIITPPKDYQTSENKVVIEGTTDKEARIFINSQEIFLKENNRFREEISLDEGENTLIIVAVSKQGKETKLERIIKRTP